MAVPTSLGAVFSLPSCRRVMPTARINGMFMAYANSSRLATMSEVDTMDSRTFRKFCKDCPSLMDADINQAEVDFIFSQSLPKNQARIALPQFLDALAALALKKLPGFAVEDAIITFVTAFLIPHYDLFAANRLGLGISTYSSVFAPSPGAAPVPSVQGSAAASPRSSRLSPRRTDTEESPRRRGRSVAATAAAVGARVSSEAAMLRALPLTPALSQGQVEEIFDHYAGGQAEAELGLDAAGFAKLVRECPGLLDTSGDLALEGTSAWT
jgi:hypothetical protein